MSRILYTDVIEWLEDEINSMNLYKYIANEDIYVGLIDYIKDRQMYCDYFYEADVETIIETGEWLNKETTADWNQDTETYWQVQDLLSRMLFEYIRQSIYKY